MKRSLPALAVALAAVVASGLSASRADSSDSAVIDALQLAAPPAALVQYGYVRSLTPSGGRYHMRFDPALWLSGETARRAAVEDGVLTPGEPVPNDYYIRNESKKRLSYVVPRSARVTVVTNSAGNLRSTRITVAELAAIVSGGNPKGRQLYGRNLGYWIRITGDRVTRLDQQYQP